MHFSYFPNEATGEAGFAASMRSPQAQRSGSANEKGGSSMLPPFPD